SVTGRTLRTLRASGTSRPRLPCRTGGTLRARLTLRAGRTRVTLRGDQFPVVAGARLLARGTIDKQPRRTGVGDDVTGLVGASRPRALEPVGEVTGRACGSLRTGGTVSPSWSGFTLGALGAISTRGALGSGRASRPGRSLRSCGTSGTSRATRTSREHPHHRERRRRDLH